MLRMYIVVHRNGVALTLCAAMRHGDGFGKCGRLIKQRGIRQAEPRELEYEGLKIQECLETSLADLGLVGRVGGVPGRVLQYVAQHHRWCDGAVITRADHCAAHGVARRNIAEQLQHFGFTDCAR